MLFLGQVIPSCNGAVGPGTGISTQEGHKEKGVRKQKAGQGEESRERIDHPGSRRGELMF